MLTPAIMSNSMDGVQITLAFTVGTSSFKLPQAISASVS
jgi:hypothetical protein